VVRFGVGVWLILGSVLRLGLVLGLWLDVGMVEVRVVVMEV